MGSWSDLANESIIVFFVIFLIVPLSKNLTAGVLAVDYGFTETFELELLAGRYFDDSMNQILQLIAKGFVHLIVIALLLAAPLTWYLSKDWLAEFAYRIEFPWWTTFLSGLAVMLIAFSTIGAQSIRAALSNPVDAIRND